MMALRAFWPGLAVLSAGWGLLLGVPLWLSALFFLCAITPPAVGSFIEAGVRTDRNSYGKPSEIEVVLWVALATAGTASTGAAASPLNILFAIPIGLAWMGGSPRLAAEAVGFSLLGYVLAAVAGGMTSWVDPEHAATLGAAYGASGLAMAGLVAGFGVVRKSAPVGEKPIAGRQDDPELTLKMRQAEARAKHAEAAVAAARAEAEAAKGRLESRTRFFAQTSHELRTPLNSIIGFAEMMRNAVFGPLPDRYQEYAELIHEGGKGLALVVDDVLDLSRMDAARFEIFPEPVSLTDLAAEAVHFMRDAATRRSIELSLDENDDVEAFADTKAVRQIALNLISNALKFTPEGGSVTVAAIEGPGGALLAVSDTGAGISPEELKRLSHAFEQGEAGKSQKGTGLGLSVVRAFAELHGGRLDIESRQGGGSTIAVFFPDEKAGRKPAGGGVPEGSP